MPKWEVTVIRATPDLYGQMDATIDPVVKISIHNGLSTYDFSPDEIIEIKLRRMDEEVDEGELKCQKDQ